ncbi:MAG: response regulator transcription factor [Betaproteobacteria bacterium]|nr:MAG: response regulator transcription factor [Betaproteobacteria bacterium]
MPVRILIADDHAVVAEGLQHVVAADSAFEVVGRAGDGREAVLRAIELEPDIVVMDMAMPEMNGIEATRAIHDRIPRTRVIMLSMYSNPEYVYRALQAGASGFVVKRSAARELVDAIRAVHAGRHYFSAQIAESVIGRYVGTRAPGDPLRLLSAREREVLQLLAESKSVADIAGILHVSPKTVETYRARLYEKLGLHDLPGLVRFAIQHGVTSLE